MRFSSIALSNSLASDLVLASHKFADSTRSTLETIDCFNSNALDNVLYGADFGEFRGDVLTEAASRLPGMGTWPTTCPYSAADATAIASICFASSVPAGQVDLSCVL